MKLINYILEENKKFKPYQNETTNLVLLNGISIEIKIII